MRRYSRALKATIAEPGSKIGLPCCEEILCAVHPDSCGHLIIAPSDVATTAVRRDKNASQLFLAGAGVEPSREDLRIRATALKEVRSQQDFEIPESA